MKPRILLGVLAILAAYMLFLGRAGLMEPDEARYAEIAREMRASGDFLLPTLNGFAHYQKPPVIYWTTAACMGLFGENELGARMPPLLAALGVLLLTGYIGTRLFDARTGRAAVWLLASSALFFVLGHGLCPDMVMTFWITLAIAAFVWAQTHPTPRRMRFLPYFACMGIAFATKGPMGIVVPLSAGVAWRLGARRDRQEPSPGVPWTAGLAVTLALGLAWFLACIYKDPQLANYFFTYELVQRFASHTHGRSEPIWFFFPVLIGGWLPWTPLLPSAIAGWRRSRREGALPTHARWVFLGWIVLPLVLLSLSGSKLMTYVLPLFPGIAIWLAHGFLQSQRTHGAGVALGIQLLLLGSLLAAAGVVSFFPALLPTEIPLDRWFFWVLLGTVAWTAASCTGLRRQITERRLLLAASAFALLLCLVSSQVVHLGPILGTSASLRSIAYRMQMEPDWKTAQIIVAGTRRHGLEFYLGRLVDNTREHADTIVPPAPDDAKRLHEDVRHLHLESHDGARTYVLTRKRELTRGTFPETDWSILAREGAFVLLRYRHSRPHPDLGHTQTP